MTLEKEKEPTILFVGLEVEDIDHPENGRLCYGMKNDSGFVTHYAGHPDRLKFAIKQIQVINEILMVEMDRMGVK